MLLALLLTTTPWISPVLRVGRKQKRYTVSTVSPSAKRTMVNVERV